MQPNLEAALRYIKRGWHVFPIVEDSKRPACANGVHDATTDPERIREMWGERNYNIGWCPDKSGHCVIDTDPPDGENNLALLEIEHSTLPDTLTHSTPRGGRHRIFHGRLPPTTGKLAPHVDTRGVASYVLLPPSTINGVPYEPTEGKGAADIPEWCKTTLLGLARRQGSLSGANDSDANCARVRTMLAGHADNQRIAVSGRGGNETTYRLAATVLNLGVSPATAFRLMAEEWNPHCIPPWVEDDLADIVHNASEYAQNEPGCWGTEAGSVRFAGADLTGLGEPAANKAPNRRFRPLSVAEQNSLPDPIWLIPELLPDQGTLMLYGPGDSFKSFVALDLALAIAAGKATFGHVPTPKPTFYIAGEGARGIARERRPAWQSVRGVADEDLPFYVIGDMPNAATDQFREACEEIKAICANPGLIVIDTLARAMGDLDENSTRDAGQMIAAAEMLRRELGCAIILVHHTGKDVGKGGRGSTAIQYGIDAAAEVTANHGERTVKVRVTRQKDGERRERPWHFKGHKIGGSLVFDAWVPSEATGTPHQSPPEGLVVLASLSATGPEGSVPSPVLAS